LYDKIKNDMKKKLLLSLSLALLLGTGAIAQNYIILVQPAGVKEWGYADLSGKLIIDAKYKKCIGFSEDGLAAIYDGKLKQFYFINTKGETLPTEVTDFKLIEVLLFGMKGFNDGFVPVKISEKWGFLNTEGKLAIPAIYDKVTVLNDGFASVQKGTKFFTVDKNAAEFPVDVADLADVNDFSEGLASFKTGGDQVGFIDGTGKVVIDAKYQAAGDFHGGLAWAKNSTGKVGYINTKGEWVVEAKFEAGKNYDKESGLARVKTGDAWAYVTSSGDLKFMKDSESWDDFNSGLARGKKGGKWGFFNADMVWAIEPKYDGARDFKNGYAAVKSGELWGVINNTGTWIIEPKYDDIKDVELVN
jgi:hypothetical protein